MNAFTKDELQSIFIWGAVGGALPTLGKIAGTYGANFDAPPPHFLGVLIAITLYSTIGAVVSRAIGNPDMKQALFAGIAAPAIVVSVLAGASDSQSLHPKQQSSAMSFLSAALAQSPNVDSSLPKNLRPLNVLMEANTSYPVEGSIQILATMDGKNLTPISDVQFFGSKVVTQVSIPAVPTRLAFRSSNGAYAVLEVNKESMVTVDVFPVTSFGKDFQWALGGQRTLAIGRLAAVAQ
jgi:hypothetical protein